MRRYFILRFAILLLGGCASTQQMGSMASNRRNPNLVTA